MFSTLRSTLSRFRRLLPFVAPFFSRLILVFGLSLFGTILGLLWPIFTKILIDDVLLAKNLHLLWILSGVMILVTAAGYLVGAINRYYYTQVTARILFSLREYLFSHLQSLSLRFHSRVRIGDILARLNTDISEVQSVLTDAAFAFITNILVLVATVGFLLWLDWRLFLVSLIVVPLQFYGVAKVRPLMVEETRKVRELNASLGAFLVEALSAIKLTKLFTAEASQQRRLHDLGEQFVPLVTRYEMLSYLGSTVSSATTFLGGALTTLYGGYLVMQGQLSIGGLIAFSSYQARAFSPLQALMDLYLRIERAGVSLDRLFEFLDIGKEQVERIKEGACPSTCRGVIEFREVGFFYDTRTPILQNVNFTVRAEECLTILGPSGTGKTTIVDLLVRLYEPMAGAITFDGHPLRELSPAWLRKHVVVVGHDPFLFHASVEENLRYAQPTATYDELRAAAKMVGLDEFVATLPEGYATLVGERGTRLSAGQKQRLALAQAVLRKPQVLVLDEALSGLDSASESVIRQTLQAFMAGKTTIIITHRLSSVQKEDRVLVLDNGKVAWDGPYGNLLAGAEDLRVKLSEWDKDIPGPQSQAV
jgi:ABC-type bacteriocin/lantibiotic exporter with double-glycine peptidase domain